MQSRFHIFLYLLPQIHITPALTMRFVSGHPVLRGGGGVRVRDSWQHGGAQVHDPLVRGRLRACGGVGRQRRECLLADRRLR